ncbi:MAG: hypothetical protein PHF67_03425 [Candidatus Nanoarchaeia archaeon]|nr:hypothetical protein [Candidatus Nanoarchaeia archaeon]
MVDVPIIKKHIVEALKRRGPSLPIQIAGEIKQNSIFTSAFLSELVDEKQVKVSHLMVGGSHLYFLEGQEDQLEKFTKYLHPKEAEAFLLLKDKRILKESEQEPAIRVALKEIRDFSESFKDDEEIYWKLIRTPNSEIELLFKEKKSKQPSTEENRQSSNLKKPEPEAQEKNIAVKEETQLVKEEPKLENIKKETDLQDFKKPEPIVKKIKRIIRVHSKKPAEIIAPIFDNPLVKKIEKPKKESPKSEFVLNVIKYLEEINFKVIEEKEHKLKEYLALVEVDSPLGPITFLTQAKDKQTINDSDLQKLLSDAQSIPLPALMLYNGNLTKKSIEYAEKYSSVLKLRKMQLD